MRLRWVLLGACAAAAAAACATDPELTCGAPCADGAVADTGVDVTITDGGTDAANDVVTDAASDACKGDGGFCGSNNSCCSGACSETNHCVAACDPQGTTCSQQSCCINYYCGDSSTCTQCKQDNTGCSQDYECCGGSCSIFGDSGVKRCNGN
jgi:hypothetical protein